MLNKTLQKIVEYIKYNFQPEKIILFGSYADGREDVYSDVDLIIITDNVYNRNYQKDIIKKYIAESALRSDVLIYTPKEILRASKNPSSFLTSVMKAGKVIFERIPGK